MIKQLLQSANKIDILDAQLLLAHILSQPREYIIAHLEKKVGFFDKIKFKKLIKKRKKGIPFAYLIGHKEFFGFDFIVNKHTLIPRPETEILVEAVLKKMTDNKYILIDVGTGTGCIPIAIGEKKKLKIFATDISKKALQVAKKNAKKYKVDITFLHGNLLEPILDEMIGNKQIIITANLPYLTEEQYKSEKSIQSEPKSALVAKDNGLILYKKLLEQIKLLSASCFLEIDPSQSSEIVNFIQKILPRANVEIKKDLAGRNRIVTFNIDN